MGLRIGHNDFADGVAMSTLIPGALLWLAMNVYHESRGEPDIAQHAVTHVTLNRAKEKGLVVQSVVKEPGQFSWRLDRNKRESKPWKEDPEQFLKCSLNVVKAVAGKDPTNGATHFHEAKMKPAPKWTKTMKKVGKIGGFIFYKEKKNV